MADYQPTGEVDKRKVTMRRVAGAGFDNKGKLRTDVHEAVDYVRPDILDAYLADARSKWDSVEVSDKPDAGPGGYGGATHVPEHLDHPLSGQTFDAEEN